MDPMDDTARPLPILVLGSTTCEDTAVTRSRLRALGVPFDEVAVDRDPAAAARVAALNGGHRVTPTVVFGDEAMVVAEPTLERLDQLLAEAGYDHELPAAVEFHGDLVERAIPLRALPAVGGEALALGRFRGSSQVALFLAHGPECLACLGYARQLSQRAEDLTDADAKAVVVVGGEPGDATDWREQLDARTAVAADPGAAWKQLVAAHIGARADDAILLILDRFLAPRAGSWAADAGGLITPSAAVDWLRFTLLDCPECSGELPWPSLAADPS